MSQIGKQHVISLITKYWEINLIFALVRSGVFTAMDGDGVTLDDLHKSLAIAKKPLKSSINAAVALGYLQKEGDSYSLATNFSNVFTTQKGGILNWIKVMERWQDSWVQLNKWMLNGNIIEPREARIQSDEEYVGEFIQGMHEFAQNNSSKVAHEVSEYFTNQNNTATFLDIGSGIGTYSFSLLENIPNTTATLIDTEKVLELAKSESESRGLAARINFIANDYTQFGEVIEAGVYDFVIFSHVLHQEEGSIVVKMLKQAHDSLKYNGFVVIHGYVIDESGIGPGFVNLHNISAQILWEGGQSYSEVGFSQLLEQARFTHYKTLSRDRDGRTLIVAEKAI